ncbi:uncharacterized protein [Rutidosis leptorrhynchoides]|uniref:uncharacterized protein n=1 Tax=Rutidosis leptorrhynchoides TaxID=125765 RepID=UPI003A998955
MSRQSKRCFKLLINTRLFKLEVTKYSLKAVHPTYTVKDATSEPAFVEKFLEEFKKEQRGNSTKSISTHNIVSHEVSQATNCGSTVTLDVEESVNLSNNTSYTPPKKMIKQEDYFSGLMDCLIVSFIKFLYLIILFQFQIILNLMFICGFSEIPFEVLCLLYLIIFDKLQRF